MRACTLGFALLFLGAAPRLCALPAQSAAAAADEVLATIEVQLSDGHADSARSLAQQVEINWKQTLRDQPIELAARLEKLARLFIDYGGRPEARPMLQDALALREAAQSPSHIDVALAHELFVLHHYKQREFKLARQHQERVIDIRDIHAVYDSIPARAADDFYNLGHLCYLLDDHAASLSANGTMLEHLLRAPEPNHRRIATGLSDMAEAHRRLGHYAEAESLMVRAIGESDAHLPRGWRHAVYLNNLGLLYWEQDRLDEAERLLREALRISDEDSETAAQRMIRAHENLGVLTAAQGKVVEAEVLLRRSLELAHESFAPDDVRLVTILDALGKLLSRLGQWDEAIQRWKEALDVLAAQEAPHDQYRATILHNVARGQRERGDLRAALASCEEALAIRERILDADHPDLGMSLAELAQIHAALNGPATEVVEDMLARAILILQASNVAPRVVARSFALRAQMHMARGQRDAAIEDMTSAIEIVEELRPRRGAGDETRAQFLTRFVGYYNTIIKWLVDAGRLETALQYAERTRARVLLDQLSAARVDLRRDVPPDRLATLEDCEKNAKTRINSTRREINAIVSRGDATGSSELAKLETNLEDALREYEDAVDQIRLLSPTWQKLLGGGEASLSVGLIQKRLVEHGTLLLLYQVGSDGSYLFVIPPAPEPMECHRLDIPEHIARTLDVEPGPLRGTELARILLDEEHGRPVPGATSLVAQLRGVKALALDEPTTGTSGFAKLYALFQMLLPQGVRERVFEAVEVVLIPDDVLHLVPFEALVVNPPEPNVPVRYWLDDGPPVRYAQGLTPLLQISASAHRERKPSPRTVLSVSDPIFVSNDETETAADLRTRLIRTGSIPPLPNSALESAAIRAAFANQETIVLQGFAASEAQVKRELPRARYAHIATHGIVEAERDELLAALVLTLPSRAKDLSDEDGFLHLFEIYELNLDCDLAVLSACGTNLGRRVEGEGMFTIARGFLTAGARRVVGSLWPVAERSTAELMAEFFRLIGEAERNDDELRYAALLHAAKKRLRSDPEWQEPFHWAPFVLSGAR